MKNGLVFCLTLLCSLRDLRGEQCPARLGWKLFICCHAQKGLKCVSFYHKMELNFIRNWHFFSCAMPVFAGLL